VYFWILLALGLAGGTAVAFMSGIGERAVEVVGQMARGNLTVATAGRQPVYWLTWQMIKEKPLFGRGLETFSHDFFYFRADTEVGQSTQLIHQEGSFRQVHNDYLQVGEELGLIGLFLLLALLIIPIARTLSLIRALDDEADVYWNGILGIAVIYVMIGCLAFFPLRLTVTGSYIVLLLACLRWYQCPESLKDQPRARESSWQLIPVVLSLVALLFLVGIPLYRTWDANGKLGTASFLIEQVSSGQVPTRQKQPILGRVLSILDSASAIDEEFPEIYNLKGGAYLLLGEYPLAAENYSLAASRIPSAEVLTNLAAAQIATGKKKEAEELVRRALRYDPQYTKAQQALQYLESQQQP
jgi:tetratricopeptide (TPR) repeat protein